MVTRNRLCVFNLVGSYSSKAWKQMKNGMMLSCYVSITTWPLLVHLQRIIIFIRITAVIDIVLTFESILIQKLL